MARAMSEQAVARASGATRYFTGRPCKHGHIAQRTTNNGTCVECAKNTPANSRERNKQRCAAWAAANQDRKREAWREWKANNPEAVKESAARYNRNNRAKVTARFTEWRAKNPERAKEWRREWLAANRDRLAEQRAQRRAMQKYAAVSWADKGLVAAFYAEAARLTLETGIKHEVDHIDPLVHPLVCGLHNEFNLRVTTASENRRKSNRFVPGLRNDG